MRSFACDRALEILERYFRGDRVPGVFAGHRLSTQYVVDFAFLLKQFHDAGMTHLGPHRIIDLIRRLLTQVNRDDIVVFWSYRIAEIILAFGKFDSSNPLLAPLSDADRAMLARAVDSSGIFNPTTRRLTYKANNYWAVLARCEYDRERLGLLQDRSILDYSLQHVNKLLAENPLGFLDDSADHGDHFDIYSFGTLHNFLEPIWHLLDPQVLARSVRSHAELLHGISLRCGALIAWGRSSGMSSVIETITFGAGLLRHNLSPDPACLLALMDNTFQQIRAGWFDEGFVAAHRYRMTDAYRGPHRLLQMTFDMLVKLATAANDIAGCKTPPALRTPLFPPCDRWFDFRPAASPGPAASRPGVWMFRNEHLEFQLPVVGGASADYVPWLRSPGLFENPVGSDLLCATPRVWARNPDHGKSDDQPEYAAIKLPARIEKSPSGLTLHFDRLTRVSPHERAAPTLGGTRTVTYRVSGNTITITESWTFEELPTAIHYMIPETTAAPLSVAFTCSSDHAASVVHVQGMQFFRSFWGEFARLHQVDIVPAKRIELVCTITPETPTWRKA